VLKETLIKYKDDEIHLLDSTQIDEDLLSEVYDLLKCNTFTKNRDMILLNVLS